MADTEIKAIPTEYRGVQLKSRLEAQAAFLFDKLGWKWQYEPGSFMLPNGISYQPDFLLPRLLTMVECRGYSSPKGNSQVLGFMKLLFEGLSITPDPVTYPDSKALLARYIVLPGDRAPFVVEREGHLTRSLALVKCKNDGWGIPRMLRDGPFRTTCFQLFCPSCIDPMETVDGPEWDGKPLIEQAVMLTTSQGKILLNGAGVDEFNG